MKERVDTHFYLFIYFYQSLSKKENKSRLHICKKTLYHIGIEIEVVLCFQ